MPYTKDFATATSATGAELAAVLNQAGFLGTIPCTIVGTNTLTLTVAVNAPTVVLQTQLRFSGIAVATNTGAVTVGGLNVYKDTATGPVALSGGEIIVGNYVVFAYDPALNSGSGGYHLQTPTINAAGSVTSVVSGAGLTAGTITNTGTISLASIADKRLLANISGGSAAPSAQSFSALLDNIISSTNGAMLQRVGGTWVAALRGQILGTATNDDAAAGDIGEFTSSQVLFASAVALTSTVAANVTSISLTAGDWNVWASARFTGGNTTTVSVLSGSISSTSASQDNTGLGRVCEVAPAGGTPFNGGIPVIFMVGPTRFSLGSTTTVYLVSLSTFGTSTCSAYGEIMGRRVR
jgi:hypothetical protein